jgi:hypothetical protein
VVEIQRDALEGIEKRGQSYHVGKLIDDQIVSKGIIKSTLVRGWKPSGTCRDNYPPKLIGEQLLYFTRKCIRSKQ